jgi:NAD(P)-dependent dehydrogenase (short-subunit alcohol dehydrogenase family)
LHADSASTEECFLVSGGSGGIGAAVCELLAARGFTPVVGFHRNAAAGAAVAQRTGGRSLALDLSDEASIQAAVARLEGSVLAGVVLAGSPPLSLMPFGRITADEMQQQWQVNVLGPQRLLAELVRRCFRQRKQGSVVGVLTRAMGGGDGDGTGGAASGLGAYVIAKHGMAGMLALLAADYPWLRVRSVRPGYTETRMLDAFDERFLALQREKAPFQTPEQVASMIVEEAVGP